MQNQEHLYSMPEPTPQGENQINLDPRKQAQTQEFSYQSYTEGYRGNERRDIWSEGQKLQPAPQSQKSMGGLIAIIALLCLAFFLAGGYYSAILGWLSWVIVAVLLVVAIGVLRTNWRVAVIPMPTRAFQINEHARLMLNNGAGNVTIRRGEEGMISVAATKRIRGIGINPDKVQVHYDQYGDAVNITTEIAWNFFQLSLK
ncbi:MAG: hypothetical protein ACRDHZ_25250, partial [Ktedonobacteraceae bacterium]